MRENKEIIKKFKQLIFEIKKHNEYYFNNDSPKISDRDYDLLKKNIIKLEKKYPYLKKIETIDNLIGSTPKNEFKKFKGCFCWMCS